MKKKNDIAIVAGGAGFIGSHLVDELLKEGYKVIVLDDFSTGSMRNLTFARENYHENLLIYEVDICSKEAKQIVMKSNAKFLYILAAQWSVAISVKNPLKDAQINIYGLVNLLEAAKCCEIEKVIFATSGGTIYGNVNLNNNPLKETLSRQPNSFYGLTKSAAIDYLRIYHELYGLKSVALALGNVYGPRQSPFGESGVIAIFTHNILNQKRCYINGDGNTTRDYVYIKDVIQAFILATKKGAGLINIGTGIETSVKDIYSKLKKLSCITSSLLYREELPGEIRRVSLCKDKANLELNWTPTTKLNFGLKNVIESMRKES